MEYGANARGGYSRAGRDGNVGSKGKEADGENIRLRQGERPIGHVDGTIHRRKRTAPASCRTRLWQKRGYDEIHIKNVAPVAGFRHRKPNTRSLLLQNATLAAKSYAVLYHSATFVSPIVIPATFVEFPQVLYKQGFEELFWISPCFGTKVDI